MSRFNDQDDARALALKTNIQPPRLPLPQTLAERLGISVSTWKALIDVVWPGATSVDGVALALDYCKARNLDPFKRPVHIVPIWNNALGRQVESVWPGISELRTTAMRTGSHAGTDDVVFGPPLKQAFRDRQTRGYGERAKVVQEECGEITFPSWAQMTVYRMVQGQRVAFVGPKVFWLESYGQSKGLNVPNSMWQRRCYGQLEKCAEAAALRRAFPEELGNMYAAEEVEGQAFRHNGGPPIEEAEIVSESGDQGESAADQRAREEQQQIEDYISGLKATVAALNTNADLKTTYEAESRTWGTFTDEQVAQCDTIFNERIAALKAAKKKAGKPAGEKGEGAATQEGQNEQFDERMVRYVDSFPSRLSGIEDQATLDEFLAFERETMDTLPPELRSRADSHIEDCKAAIIADDQRGAD